MKLAVHIQERYVNYALVQDRTIIDVRKKEKQHPLAGGDIEEVFYTYGPERLKVRISQHRVQRRKPDYIITSTEEKSILAGFTQKAQKEARADISNSTGILVQDIDMIESVVEAMRINGYLVDHLKGFKGKEVWGTVRQVFLAGRHAQDSIIFIGQALLPWATKNAVRGSLAFIGDRVTQVLEISNDTISDIRVIAAGRDDFIRPIEMGLQMSFPLAEELYGRYIADQLTQDLTERIDDMIRPVQQNFRTIDYVFGAYVKGKNHILPKDIFDFQAPWGLDDTELTPLFLLAYAKNY
jgi:hypothetical protein